MQRLGLQVLTKQPSDHSFEDWWDQVSKRVADQAKKGLNSVVILVARSLWNHRNRCVFYGLQPILNGLLSTIRDELHLWNWLGPEELLISSPCSLTISLIGLLGHGLNSLKGYYSVGEVFLVFPPMKKNFVLDTQLSCVFEKKTLCTNFYYLGDNQT